MSPYAKLSFVYYIDGIDFASILFLIKNKLDSISQQLIQIKYRRYIPNY